MEKFSYQGIDLGTKFYTFEELKDININLGVIDAQGCFYPLLIRGGQYLIHREIARILKEQGSIQNFYLRVGNIGGWNEGLIAPDKIIYSDGTYLRDFTFTPEMAIAIYNAIMSKDNEALTSFEERLAYYGNDFGYVSTKYWVDSQIYDAEFFHRSVQTLSRTLGNKFDANAFCNILRR